VEGSFEREGTEGEKDADIVDKGKAEPTVDEACWIYEQLRLVSFLPVNYDFTTRMYTRVLSGNESRRMALSLCRSWKRRCYGGIL